MSLMRSLETVLILRIDRLGDMQWVDNIDRYEVEQYIHDHYLPDSYVGERYVAIDLVKQKVIADLRVEQGEKRLVPR